MSTHEVPEMDDEIPDFDYFEFLSEWGRDDEMAEAYFDPDDQYGSYKY